MKKFRAVNKFRYVLPGIILIVLCSAASLNSLYKFQSLFVYKFTKYIEWPEQQQSGDFVIGVYGNSPLLQELQTMARLKTAPQGRKIIIRNFKSLDQIKGRLHMLYVPSSKSREIKNIRSRLGSQSVLIIGERGGLARKGAAINFMLMENDVLKFEYNEKELQNRKLKINKELARLGFKVG